MSGNEFDGHLHKSISHTLAPGNSLSPLPAAGHLLHVAGVSITLSMYGIWTFKSDRYLEFSHREAINAGEAVEKGLCSDMLRND